MRKLALVLLLLVACIALAHAAPAAPVCHDGGTVLSVADQDSAVPMATGNYIGNKNSKKFHLPTCRTLPAEKNRVYFATRDEAVKAGYVPCKNCRP